MEALVGECDYEQVQKGAIGTWTSWQNWLVFVNYSIVSSACNSVYLRGTNIENSS